MAERPVDGPRIIAGLGNPGDRYRDTRHNLGFEVVAELARRWGVRLDRLVCNALVGRRGDEVLLVQPQTYMNRSGYALRCLTEREASPPERLLVVYDEVSLPLGRLRLRPSGGPGGHRGIESVLQNLRSERVPRLRLGIAPEAAGVSGDELVDYVLMPWRADERPAAEEMVGRAADACECWLAEGIDEAMNRYNR
ncbi:MAG: aminoacyl-tRNA hydrolase [Thermoanaerobaculia bacterium]